jgi:hypothetical protein
MLQSKSRRSACRERTLYTKCQHRNSCANCKTKAIIDAQAEAENKRISKGEADIFAKKQKLYIYMKYQASRRIQRSAGGDPTKAFQLLLIENYQNWLKPK